MGYCLAIRARHEIGGVWKGTLMAEVAFKQVQKSFGAVQVLKQIDLTVADGEFLVLVGPSGCGKSTLLRALAGLEGVTHGRILIDGRVVNDLPPKDRDIAMVFQNYALYPHMSVLENLTFALKLRDLKPDEIAARANQAATILGLQDLLGRYPRHLSGGQRQRVAMGRAIVRDPKVFLFDEPLSNLDAQLRVQTRTQIAELQRRLKVTTVYVTHDQVEAMTMGDRVAVMRLGKLQQFASPTELYDHPANVFVAGFIGSPAMNRLEGTLTPDGIHTGGVTIRPPDALLRAAQGHGKLVVGIRPEHLSVGGSDLALKVELVEDLGSDSYIYGHLSGDRDAKIIVRAGREHPQPGELIKVGVDTAHLHLFDAASGERVGE